MGLWNRFLASTETGRIADILSRNFFIPRNKISYFHILHTKILISREAEAMSPADLSLIFLGGYVDKMDPQDAEARKKAEYWLKKVIAWHGERRYDNVQVVVRFVERVIAKFDLRNPDYEDFLRTRKDSSAP